MFKLETKFVNDIAGKFFVPAYQRGYCLQPIVVKNLGEENFEVIDGQQRLTTLFLLHRYAAKKENIPPAETDFLKNFSYDTRFDSRD